MIKYECDRCGEQYTRAKDLCEVSYVEIGKNFDRLFFNASKEIQICARCMKQIQDFIEYKNEHKN